MFSAKMTQKIKEEELSLLKHTKSLPKGTKFHCDALCCCYFGVWICLPPHILSLCQWQSGYAWTCPPKITSSICSFNRYVPQKINFIPPIAGFYPRTFVYSRFSPKIQFVYCLLSSLSLNLVLQFAEKCITNTFSDSRNLACTSFVWSNSCTEFYWEIRRKVDYCSRVTLKNLSLITQFKIEFLQPFTSCRKVLRKMPE